MKAAFHQKDLCPSLEGRGGDIKEVDGPLKERPWPLAWVTVETGSKTGISPAARHGTHLGPSPHTT